MAALYRGFDRVELDREYSPSSCVESLAPFLEAYAQRSAAARNVLAWHSEAYGPSDTETVDFFPGAGTQAPLHVFIHGGYWRQLSKRESSFAAPGLVRAGAAFAAVDYALAPGVTLDDIVHQVRSAIAHLHRNAARLGFDPARIHISGSSAGGHLVAMVLATDWSAFGLPGAVVRGATALSGVFDLTPIRLCYVNDWLDLDEAAVTRNSPLLMAPPAGTDIIAAVGEIETAEFKRQTQDYAMMCRAAGLAAEALVVTGRNHFDIVFDLADPTSELGSRVFRQMRL